MNELKIKQMITEAMELKNPTITNIRPTPGGLTNESYFATVDDKKYVVRIPGSGTDELINRKEEKANLIYGTNLGINPPLIYFNVESGFKITEKISGATPVTHITARHGEEMLEIIHLFQKLHRKTTPMQNRFKLFDLMEHYESLVQDINDIAISKLTKLKKDILYLQNIYESYHVIETPCHIDAVSANLIKSSEGYLYLIDWEYSGMFDPMWDIATLFLSLDLKEDEQYFFLKQYFEREPEEHELQRIYMHKIFQDYLWALWGVFKKSYGDDTGNDVTNRIKRISINMTMYKEIFEKDIVL